MRNALIALGRMGDPEDRALALQRLAILRSPEVVNYLKRYLFSDVVYPDTSPDWLPVSDAQRAADTLRATLEGFPTGPLEAQRKWMGERMEYVFKATGTNAVVPGLSP